MRYFFLIITVACGQLLAAQYVPSRVGVDSYDARTGRQNAARSSFNTPPSHGQDSTGASFRGVIPYRAYDNYKGLTPSATGGYYQPITGDRPLKIYPQTATGLNMSNFPQSGVKLPYITTDPRGISSGMPELDRYNTNKIIAQTYAPGTDLRPFTENIQEFEYYIKERNFRTTDQLQREREMLSRKYMIDADENMSIKSLMEPFSFAADERKEYKYSGKELLDDEVDEEGKDGDIFVQMAQGQKKAGLEGTALTAKELAEALKQENLGLEGSRRVDDRTGVAPLQIDLSDKTQLRMEARRILGEHTTFVGYADDKFNSYMKKAEDFMDQGEYYRAADAYSLAAIFRRNDPLVHAGKSLALFGAGEYMSSAFYLNKTLILYPDYIAVKVDLVEMLGDRDVLENRIVDVQRWMARSGAGELSFLLAYVYYQMDEPQWAKEELEKAADKLPVKATAKLLADMVGANIEKSAE